MGAASVTPAEIRAAIVARHVAVGAPASAAKIAALEAAIGRHLHPFVRSIYESFDGFAEGDFDAGSFVTVWDIERILDNVPHVSEDGRFPFADVSLGLAVYRQSCEDPTEPVLTVHGDRRISASSHDFWHDLIGGRLDQVTNERSA